MRSTWPLVHLRGWCHSFWYTSVEESDAFCLICHFFGLQPLNGDTTIQFLSDADVFALACLSLIEQIVQLFQVQFQELTLHVKAWHLILSLSMRQLLKYKVEHSRHNTDVLIRQPNRASSSHSMRLAWACLPVGQDRRVIAFEAP